MESGILNPESGNGITETETESGKEGFKIIIIMMMMMMMMMMIIITMIIIIIIIIINKTEKMRL